MRGTLRGLRYSEGSLCTCHLQKWTSWTLRRCPSTGNIRNLCRAHRKVQSRAPALLRLSCDSICFRVTPYIAVEVLTSVQADGPDGIKSFLMNSRLGISAGSERLVSLKPPLRSRRGGVRVLIHTLVHPQYWRSVRLDYPNGGSCGHWRQTPHPKSEILYSGLLSDTLSCCRFDHCYSRSSPSRGAGQPSTSQPCPFILSFQAWTFQRLTCCLI
jgi:hypothetical protein